MEDRWILLGMTTDFLTRITRITCCHVLKKFCLACGKVFFPFFVLGAGKKGSGVFVPHLIPINRGILSTIYVKLAKKITTEELLAVYKTFYAKEPFVKVYDAGRLPEIKNVTNTNFCDIGLKVNEEKGLAVIVTTIDNLDKGAAGQAIQNMNIMCGFAETSGL